MPRALDKSMLAGVGLVTAVLVVSAAVTYRNTNQLDEDAGWVAHTNEVLDRAHEFLLTFVDAETGERGFLVTGKDEFLEPYELALTRIHQQLRALRDATTDNSDQQARIGQLVEMTDTCLAELQHGIDLRRRNAAPAELLAVSRQGKAEMDAIRSVVGDIAQTERTLLSQRRLQSTRTYHTAITTGLLTAALALAALGAFVWLLQRSLSAREQAARLIHGQRELFRTTLASIGDAVITTDTEGKITFMNSVAETLTGWQQAAAAGSELPAVFHIVNEQSRQPVENPASRALREGIVVGLANHTILISRDGVERPIDDSAAPIRDDHGNVAGVVLVFRDVAERRRSEHSIRFLADASATLAAVVDERSTLQKFARISVPFFADWCAVDMLDDGGELRRVVVAHVDPKKVEFAHTLQQRFPPDRNAEHGAWKVIRSGLPEMISEVTDKLVTDQIKDPERRRIVQELGLRSYIAVPLQARGQTLGVITFVAAESGRRYDATDLALAEDLANRAGVAVQNARLYRELQVADRLKDEFLATLAHELRNPLAPIRNALQILKQPSVDVATRNRLRDMSERQVQHMARLLDDLLDVSRISRGKIELRKEVVDVAAIVVRTVETLRPLAEERGHHLEVVLPHDPILVEGDVTRLEQILSNLVNNSIKYTDAGGTIGLVVEREPNEVVLRVRDNGIGIGADLLPRIFDLFVQAERRLDRSQGGIGIGLTLVRRLVELHGGTVAARSGGLGTGSEFIIRLPVLTDTNRRAAPAKESPGAPSGALPRLRVLVVDDNEDAAESLAVLLRLEGQDAQVAFNGPAALTLAESFRPQLVFLDIGMPGMDGYEVARKLRALPGLGKVVLVAQTGWGQEEDRRRSQETGFNHHLIKPADPAAVRALLVTLAPTSA